MAQGSDAPSAPSSDALHHYSPSSAHQFTAIHPQPSNCVQSRD